MKKRDILWWLLFVGIICHMLQMTSMNVAIIEMVKQPKHSDAIGFCNSARINYSEQNTNKSSEIIIDSKHEDTKFNWTIQEQNLIFSSFFWFSWASELCGGILSHKYGSKITFGFTNFIVCLLSSAIPILAPVSSTMVVVVRLLQGTIGAIGLPAGIVTIIGQWAPPHERGRFVSTLLGIPFGISFSFFFFGILLSYFGWACIFYITSAIGTIWYIFWSLLVYDTPDQHPKISENEKMYIKKSLATSATTEKLPIPWKEMFLSVPIVVNIFCTFGQYCTILSLQMYYPSYLKNVHDLDSKTIGLLTGLPFLVKSLLQIITAITTDSMIKRGQSRTRVRNLTVWAGSIFPGFFLLGILFMKCDVVWAVTLLSIFIVINAFTSCGPPVALVDMSPNFCGILHGINCAIGTSSGVLCAMLFNYLSLHFEILDAWGYFFFVLGLLNIIPGIIYVLFSDSELQSWNSPKKLVQDELLQPINT